MRGFALFACFAAATALWGSEPSPVVKEGQAIRRLVASHTEAWNRRDWNSYVSSLSEDFDSITTSGRLDDRATLVRPAADGARMSASVRQIRFIKPDIAMVDAAYEVAGGPEGTRHGQKVYLVEKRNGAWTIVAERTSDGSRSQASVSGQ